MAQSELDAWAKLLGRAGAHVQDSLDQVADWGFKKIQEAGAQPKRKKKHRNPYVATVASVGKGALHFVGSVGNAFYSEYDSLKKKRSAN